MIIGRVLNSIWSTRKDESLTGAKLMVVKLLDRADGEGKIIVAVDLIGAGIGERVLVCQGSSARQADGFADAPIDSMIVGIIDESQPEF